MHSNRTPRSVPRAARWPSALLSLLSLLGSCVFYEPQEVTLAGLAAATPSAPPGPLDLAHAMAFALQHNPELHRLAAEARAAGADVPATEIQGQWSGDDRRLAAMIDPIALLQLGARGAAADLAAARREEALAALAVARWRMLGAITEVFAALTAVESATPPRLVCDVEAFVQAGLASPAAAAMARGASASAAAERLALAADREALLAELRPLLGLPGDAALTLAPLAPDYPPLPPRDPASLLRRPDLALAIASYRVADAEFRRAVAEQYPSLMIGPDLPLGAGAVDAMAWFRVPLGADGPAIAARERRDAARARATEALLAASNRAVAAGSQHEALAQRAAAASATAAGSAIALAAAEAAAAVEIDAFLPLAEGAQAAVRDAMERRLATVAAARARVQLAVAYGWPTALEQR